MTLDVTLAFKGPGAPTFPIVAVHRVEVRDALSELFEVVLHVASTELAADLGDLLRQHVIVTVLPAAHEDEALGRAGGAYRFKDVEGIIRRVRQLTTVLPGDDPTALYEITVAPFAWLTTRRRDRRIFQGRTVPQIVQDVLEKYAGMPAPAYLAGLADDPVREYCAQYDETDWDFVCRILSEERIATYFDHAAGSVFTMVADPGVRAPPPQEPVVVAPSSNMVPSAPHVANVVPSAQIEITAADGRDYDFTRPATPPQGGYAGPPADEPSEAQTDLRPYAYEEWRRGPDQATSDDVVSRSTGLVTEARVAARTFVFDASFAAPPGTRLRLTGHPTRDDLNAEFLVVRLDVLIDDGDRTGPRAALVDRPVRRHTLECIRASTTFCPPVRPRPRVHGTQTAFVTGDGGAGTVEVDAYARVKLELNWDRRDLHKGNPTRWTRVAQAWAGQGYGFVTLPRVGDEVVVDYVEGDPDNPIVVGRVHDGTQRTPLLLPDGDKSLAVWRSRSFDADGLKDGFNQILMDDAAGAERLELHAQRDFRSDTGRNSVTTVGNDASSSVVANSTNKVGAAYSLSSGSTSISTGSYSLSATTIDEAGRDHVKITTKERTDESQTHLIHADGVYVAADSYASVSAGVGPGDSQIKIEPGSITLTNGASVVKLQPVEITLVCGGSSVTLKPAEITLFSAGKVNITGVGGVTITSPGTVDVHGTPIKLNC